MKASLTSIVQLLVAKTKKTQIAINYNLELLNCHIPESLIKIKCSVNA